MFTVLGAAGFVGSRLVRSLHELGFEVFAPPRGEGPHIGSQLGHVIYCVGLTSDFRSRPFDTVRAHVTLLADYLEKADFESFLYLSSTRVYSGSEVGHETQDLRVNPHDKSDIYNISKLMGEALVLNSTKPNVRVARLSNVVGPDVGSENFLVQVCREAMFGRIRLRTALSSSKDYIHIDEVVDYLRLIAIGGRRTCYNVASGVSLTHQQLVSRIVELTGCELVVDPGAPISEFPHIDTSLITEEFEVVRRPVLDSIPRILAALEKDRDHGCPGTIPR